MRHLALLILGLGLVGCAMDTMRTQEGEGPDAVCKDEMWPQTKGPAALNHENHDWYLDQITLLYPTLAPVCSVRKTWPHADHPQEVSWARIQVAYWVARCGLPQQEVDHWLGTTMATTGWTPFPFKPGPAPPVGTSAGQLLDDALAKVQANPPLLAMVDAKLALTGVHASNLADLVKYRKAHVYPRHSCAAAWAHAWAAFVWSQQPPDPLTVHWIICEIDHN